MRYTVFGVLFSLSMSVGLWAMQGDAGPAAEKKEVAAEGAAISERGAMKEQKIEQLADNADVIPGIYEHFKNKNHRYEVVGVARFSEDPHQEFVVYKSLYESTLEPEEKKLPSGTLWVRPKKMFLELVPDPADKTKLVPRFKKVSQQ